MIHKEMEKAFIEELILEDQGEVLMLLQERVGVQAKAWERGGLGLRSHSRLNVLLSAGLLPGGGQEPLLENSTSMPFITQQRSLLSHGAVTGPELPNSIPWKGRSGPWCRKTNMQGHCSAGPSQETCKQPNRTSWAWQTTRRPRVYSLRASVFKRAA